MKRRQALAGLSALPLVLARTSAALAQSSPRAIVIGLLDAGERREWWEAFRQQFRELGYVEGRNVTLEQRFAKGRLEALPALANELVQLKVAAIVTSGSAAATAAQRATTRIPIVMASGSDQVSLGLASTLARPGGNVTGISSLSADLMVKRFELLREILPKVSRLAVLWHADNTSSRASVRDLDRSAANARLVLQSYGIRSAEGLADAFAAMARDHKEAVIVVNSPLLYGERGRIAELAVRHRMPLMCGASEYAEAGGLVSYAPSYSELFRQAAIYLDRILKGASPGDLPIEQASKFELVINAKTAQALGIAIPPSILSRADRVLQ